MENRKASKTEVIRDEDFEWDSDYLRRSYIGRRIHMYAVSESANDAYEPYIRRSLYAVTDVDNDPGGDDDVIRFKLRYVDYDVSDKFEAESYQSIELTRPPDKIVIDRNHETWVYDNGSDEPDFTLEFVV